ncbi:MAG: VOC family protein [Chloroflexi bacterium]|nr:VOC family protein [Chloroflexota bacterium]
MLSTCLWFDDRAEEAANFYTGIFKDSEILSTMRYPKAAEAVAGKPAGSVMTVDFVIMGQRFMALNGGPEFRFNESVSLVIPCADQREVDYYWERLVEGGEESACGWLKDKFGLSWQVVPDQLDHMLRDGNQNKVEAVTAALMDMRKLDIATLQKAYETG